MIAAVLVFLMWAAVDVCGNLDPKKGTLELQLVPDDEDVYFHAFDLLSS